jgi:phosphoglycolate phosphatase
VSEAAVGEAGGSDAAPAAPVAEGSRPTSTDRLVLWDVDGTLLRAGDISRVVFERAVTRVLGRVPPARVSMGGKTDPQIVREYLTLAGVADPDIHVDPILAELLAELSAARHLIAEQGEVMPGVGELLAALHADPHVLQSVLTGNLAANALVKVGAFGLDAWLDLEVGAFGSDHHDRRELVPIALERAARLRGRHFAPAQVWVVGDTANDLACARAAGARCLLVATGRWTRDQLAGLGPDGLLDDLTDTAAVLGLLAA